MPSVPDPAHVKPWYLRNITEALALEESSGNVYVRTGFTGNIIISGNVNIPGTITVDSTPEDPVHVHLDEVGTSGILDVPYLPVSVYGNIANITGNVKVTQGTIPWSVSGNVDANITGGNISITGNIAGITSLPSIQANITGGNISVTGNIAGITSLPSIQANVTGGNINANVTQGTIPWSVSGNVNANITGGNVNANVIFPNIYPVSANTANNSLTNPISIQIAKNGLAVSDTNRLPVDAKITDVITVIAEEDPGELYAFNNNATNTNRGWTMDEVMRPVVSFQNGSVSVADIIKILEYEIGNNNANQSTIVYEWYEGPLTISGAAIPAWTTFGVHSQYRVYQDKYSSNQGNTFTVPAGTYMRHSGIIIGKNTSGDEGPANLRGGDSRNMLTLCMRRVDNTTKLDVWFAFTVKELT